MQSGPIQVLPSGLLGFLNIKNAGQNPSTLDSNVVPTLDIRDWWFQTNAEFSGANPLTPGRAMVNNDNGFLSYTSNQLFVPDGEWWWVEDYSLVSSTLGAGDSIAAVPAMKIQLPATVRTWILGDMPSSNVTGANNALGVGSRRAFWAPPGAELGIFARSCTIAVGINVFGCLRFARLPI